MAVARPKSAASPSGIINAYKPQGITSRRVVDHVQRLVRPAKAGHAGTLDPLASGVLVVCVGQATRLIEYVQQQTKRYRGTFLLGRRSDTEDIEGQVEELPSPPVPTSEQLEAALANFVGEIQQRPPAFSALKVDGKRAYDLARQGQQVELKPRPVTVYSLKLLAYAYPLFQLDIACSAGTYVRSLGRDIAESLGTAAVMSALERTAVGQFTVEKAVPLDELTADTWQSHLQPATTAVADLPTVSLGPDELKRLANGHPLDAAIASTLQLDQGQEVAGVFGPHCEQAGDLAAILVLRGRQLKVVRNFAAR